MSKILAIESSCDETSAAVISDGKICSNVIATQSIHGKYGGVVPELASRAHQSHIVPVITEALNQANIAKASLNAIAFTQGPGLLGALLVGASFAKGMAAALQIPLIGVNHMRAHILAHFIEDPKPSFPFLCLTVSGGHTQIVKVESAAKMTVIGQSQDDAVGEAFDKSAKLLGLSYPGGPLIDRYAADGDPHRFKFPISNMPKLDYSFSGVKTAILYFIQKEVKENPDFVEQNICDICASIQFTFIETLMHKLKMASKQCGIDEVALAGGVSANTGLRKTLTETGEKLGWRTYIPRFEYCTDNAAMIAMAAHFQYEAKDFIGLDASPLPRMQL